MCEHCSIADRQIQLVGTDPQPVPCDKCARPATHWLIERFVESHLCKRHVRQENRALDDGLAATMATLGIQQSVEYLHYPSGGCVRDLRGNSNSRKDGD